MTLPVITCMRQNMSALPETAEMTNRETDSRDRERVEPSRLFSPYGNVLYSPIAELASPVEERPDVAHIAVLGYNQACVDLHDQSGSESRMASQPARLCAWISNPFDAENQTSG
jgi:hypothetical protein